MADQTNLAKFSYSLLIHNEPLEDSRSGQDQYDENEYFVPFEENGVEIVKKQDIETSTYRFIVLVMSDEKRPSASENFQSTIQLTINDSEKSLSWV